MHLVGHVAELVYAYVSEAYLARGGSSSLPMPTRQETRSVSDARSVATATERQGFWARRALRACEG